VNESGGTTTSLMRARRIHNGWRPLGLFSKGVAPLPWLVKDVIITTVREKALHPWQQPASEARYYVEALCPHGGIVCDPFVGSGTVAKAVAQCGGGRSFFGCDVDEGSVRIARHEVHRVGMERGQAGPIRGSGRVR
jgi:DNA modification methylase